MTMSRLILITALLFVLASTIAASEPFFPMHPGDFWEYETADGQHGFTIHGFTPLSANGRIYFFVNGFAPQQLMIREEIGEGLRAYDGETSTESPYLPFRLDTGSQFNAPDRGCGIVTGRVEQTRVAGSLPVGDFPSMLQLTYDTPACGQPVVQSEFFVANIGMARRVMKVGDEVRQYDLVSARVGGRILVPKTNTQITALTWSEPRQGDTALRFHLRTISGVAATTTMRFGSTQRYDLVIRDQNGNKVWQYSDGKAFVPVLGQAQAAKYEIVVPLNQLPGGSIAPGAYTVDAWLTTMGDTPRFAASVGMVIQDFGQPPMALSGSVNRNYFRKRGGLPIPGRSIRY